MVKIFLKKDKTNIYYGWVIVAIGALTLFFSGPGQTYSVSIFIDYYIAQYGWSRTAISSFYSIATLISGFTIPFVGRIIDTKGHKASTIIIALLFSLACLWMSIVSSPWMIFIGFIFIRLFGQGSLTLIPSVLIPQWFIKKRGRALSLISIGGVLGSATLPPLNHFLISTRGLTFAWIFWASALLLIMMPLAFFLIKNKPEDIGLFPDGESRIEENDEEEGYERSWTLKEAKGTRAFWLMLFCMVVPSLINTGITFHMISIVKDKGFDASAGAYILSITALTQMPLTFLAGFVLEKVKVHYVKGINFIFLGIAILLLISSNNMGILILYGVIHGIFVAFDGVSTSVLWSNYYGRAHLGKIRGITMSAMVLGSALGPLPFGAAYDVFGGYKEILLLSIALPVIASLASFLSPQPKYNKV